MSFCPSCGKELSEAESQAKFCAYCGKPLNPEEAAKATREPKPAKELPKIDLKDLKNKVVELVNTVLEKIKSVPVLAKIANKLSEKLQPIVLVVVPFVLVVALVLSLLGAVVTEFTYRTTLDRYLSLVNNGEDDSTKQALALSPDFRDGKVNDILKKALEIDSYDDSVDLEDENLKNIYKALDEEYDKWKVSFKTKSTAILDKEDEIVYESNIDDSYKAAVDQLEDMLANEDTIKSLTTKYDCSEKEITELIKAYISYYKTFHEISIEGVREVKGNFVINADKEEYVSNTVRIIFVNVNGHWVMYNINNAITFNTTDDNELLDVSRFTSIFNTLRSDGSKCASDVLSILFSRPSL